MSHASKPPRDWIAVAALVVTLAAFIWGIVFVARPAAIEAAEDLQVLFVDSGGQPDSSVILLGAAGVDLLPDTRAILRLPGVEAGQVFSVLDADSRRHLQDWTAPRGGALVRVEVRR